MFCLFSANNNQKMYTLLVPTSFGHSIREGVKIDVLPNTNNTLYYGLLGVNKLNRDVDFSELAPEILKSIRWLSALETNKFVKLYTDNWKEQYYTEYFWENLIHLVESGPSGVSRAADSLGNNAKLLHIPKYANGDQSSVFWARAQKCVNIVLEEQRVAGYNETLSKLVRFIFKEATWLNDRIESQPWGSDIVKKADSVASVGEVYEQFRATEGLRRWALSSKELRPFLGRCKHLITCGDLVKTKKYLARWNYNPHNCRKTLRAYRDARGAHFSKVYGMFLRIQARNTWRFWAIKHATETPTSYGVDQAQDDPNLAVFLPQAQKRVTKPRKYEKLLRRYVLNLVAPWALHSRLLCGGGPVVGICNPDKSFQKVKGVYIKRDINYPYLEDPENTCGYIDLFVVVCPSKGVLFPQKKGPKAPMAREPVTTYVDRCSAFGQTPIYSTMTFIQHKVHPSKVLVVPNWLFIRKKIRPYKDPWRGQNLQLLNREQAYGALSSFYRDLLNSKHTCRTKKARRIGHGRDSRQVQRLFRFGRSHADALRIESDVLRLVLCCEAFQKINPDLQRCVRDTNLGLNVLSRWLYDYEGFRDYCPALWVGKHVTLLETLKKLCTILECILPVFVEVLSIDATRAVRYGKAAQRKALERVQKKLPTLHAPTQQLLESAAQSHKSINALKHLMSEKQVITLLKDFEATRDILVTANEINDDLVHIQKLTKLGELSKPETTHIPCSHLRQIVTYHASMRELYRRRPHTSSTMRRPTKPQYTKWLWDLPNGDKGEVKLVTFRFTKPKKENLVVWDSLISRDLWIEKENEVRDPILEGYEHYVTDTESLREYDRYCVITESGSSKRLQVYGHPKTESLVPLLQGADLVSLSSTSRIREYATYFFLAHENFKDRKTDQKPLSWLNWLFIQENGSLVDSLLQREVPWLEADERLELAHTLKTASDVNLERNKAALYLGYWTNRLTNKVSKKIIAAIRLLPISNQTGHMCHELLRQAPTIVLSAYWLTAIFRDTTAVDLCAQNIIGPWERKVVQLWLANARNTAARVPVFAKYTKVSRGGASEEFSKTKPTYPLIINKLTYTSNIGEGFFFTISNPRYIKYRTRFQVWSAGSDSVVKKAERRSVKNILSWWNYIFSDYLYDLLHVVLRSKPSMLYVYFYHFNNLTLRYFFMHHLYMKNINYVPSLYFIRYNFLTKNYVFKKQRYMKKYKKKGLVHEDRFTRREFWITS